MIRPKRVINITYYMQFRRPRRNTSPRVCVANLRSGIDLGCVDSLVRANLTPRITTEAILLSATG